MISRFEQTKTVDPPCFDERLIFSFVSHLIISCYNSEREHLAISADEVSVDTNATVQSQKAGQPTFLLMIKNSARLKEKQKETLSKIEKKN